jgi:hypothetical protein
MTSKALDAKKHALGCFEQQGPKDMTGARAMIAD